MEDYKPRVYFRLRMNIFMFYFCQRSSSISSFSLPLFIYCNVIEAFCVLWLSYTLTCRILHQKMKLFSFLFDGSLTLRYRMVGRKTYLPCARILQMRKFEVRDFQNHFLPSSCFAEASDDVSIFRQTRCTYTFRVVICCAYTQFEVNWIDVRPRVDYVS